MKPIDLSKILRPFENKWVALTRDRKKVIASGATVKKVAQEANKKGEAFILHWVGQNDGLLIPVPLRKIK